METASGGRLLAAMAHHLEGVAFPATRDALLKRAEATGAPEDVTACLRKLEERRYESLPDVGKALGLGQGSDAANKASGSLGTRSRVDEASAESFPASDPPAYTPASHVGDRPKRDGR